LLQITQVLEERSAEVPKAQIKDKLAVSVLAEVIEVA
jgi:hypothetical protein